MAVTCAAVDLGATNMRVLVTDDGGSERGRRTRPTPNADADEIVEAIAETLAAACRDAETTLESVGCVGVAAAGRVDVEGGVDLTNLPPDRFPLADRLQAETGASVEVVNDAVAGVLAERRFADAPSDTVYLTLSTGIGAGVCVDGRTLRKAGEVGHLIVEPGGRECACEGHGHWEAYCGGRHIPEYTRELADAYPTSMPLSSLDAATVFDSAPADPLAAAVVDRVQTYNAIGVANLVRVYEPDLVTVGGGLALPNRETIIAPLCEATRGHAGEPMPEIRATTLGADVVVRGALATVLD